jgi:DNA-directed RNA polymerase alpha subunit
LAQISRDTLQSIGNRIVTKFSEEVHKRASKPIQELVKECLEFLDIELGENLSKAEKFEIIRTKLEEIICEECRERRSKVVSSDSNPLNKRINDLDNLTTRPRKALKQLNIETVGELIQKTEDELLEAYNFGQTSLNEVKFVLQELGLSLRKDAEPQQ